MATRLLQRHTAPTMLSTSSKRQRSRQSTSNPKGTNNRPSRPPKSSQNLKQRSGDSEPAPRSRPTHFLALPIGHHPELRSAVSALTSSWLAHDPPIEGLDASIVVNPRRLHLTLGVMAFPPAAAAAVAASRQEQQGPPEPVRDLASAMALLASLAPRIRSVLAHDALRVPLGRLAIMQPDPARAHVLYVEPDLRSPDGRRLRAVCDLVHGAFREAGFLADERRPLKVSVLFPDPPSVTVFCSAHITYYTLLQIVAPRPQLHCTLLNTTYRRPPPGQRRAAGRVPFSFVAFPPAAVSVDGSPQLGAWAVDELQICEMGSWAPDGAYVRVAGCDLRPRPS
ncbi:AKAP7 2'5' RNA ligase-like domain-containing protein [Russula dissimulans]|nr:AKAP7 2'5' RNA ligase-like domain-containing protein [Russula dissimulans]